MIERINEMRKYYSLSVNSLAERIGANQVTINQQLNGDRKISLDTINKILIAFEEVSSEWLLRGTGEMLLGEATKKDVPTSSSDSEKDEEIRNLKEEIIRLGKEVSYLEGKISVLIDDRTPREKDDQEGESA